MENAHLLTSDVQEAASVVTFEPTVPLCAPISATASVIQPKSAIYPLPAFAEETFQVPVLTKPQVSSVLKSASDIEEQLSQLASQLCPAPVSSATENCISSTATVLAPKTADMESGFLMFTDDNTGMTVLTDADDLTHLAPDAGDLCVPMLSDMDFNDLSIFDDIFLNSTSFNINGSNGLSEDDLLNNLANFDADKLKMDSFDNLNLEPEMNLKKYDSTGMLAMAGKGIPTLKSTAYEQFALSNDPFLSFGTQSDELLMSTSPVTPSSGSLSDPYSSSSNSPTGSPSSRMNHFSPPSSSGDEISDRSLCDTTDFSDDKDLEMRAPFIPIDDDFLLNDFAYSDSNMDDLLSWIGCSKTGNAPATNETTTSYGNGKLSLTSAGKASGGCLEALLQNDELVCSLKNKMYNSNQLMTGTPAPTTQTQSQQQPRQESMAKSATCAGNNGKPSLSSSAPFVQAGGIAQAQSQGAQSAMKRKNSNILIYTTLNTGDKKFKNLVLSADPFSAAKLADKGSTVHHFVLTKNNELIPKSNFTSQLSHPFKVSSKRVLPMEPDPSGNLLMNASAVQDSFAKAEDILLKKARQETDKHSYCKCARTAPFLSTHSNALFPSHPYSE